jgi:hypothetical protein
VKGRSLIELDHGGERLDMDIVDFKGQNTCHWLMSGARFFGSRLSVWRQLLLPDW